MNRLGAVRFLGGSLAVEPRRDWLAGQIAAGQVGWERVIEVASECWMTVALYRALSEMQLLGLLPVDLRAYFETVHGWNAERNRGILEHAGALAGLLNTIGVEPVLLKGAGNLAAGLYPDPAVRIMDDLDILAPADRAEECWRLLIRSGYRTIAAKAGLDVAGLETVDWPDLRLAGATGVVEMHRVAEWRGLLADPELYADSVPVMLSGGRARIPSARSRMVIAIAHSFVHHRDAPVALVPLRDLYDATLLMRRAGAEIEWPRVIQLCERHGEIEGLRLAFLMWERLLGQRPPHPLGPPRGAWRYWQVWRLCVGKPHLWLVRSLVKKNTGFLRQALSPTDEGVIIRRELAQPGMYLRKVKTAIRMCTSDGTGAEPER